MTEILYHYLVLLYAILLSAKIMKKDMFRIKLIML